jgi:pSer/pThr/pTyr-binding forkhead associated (FHA) protein
MIGIIVLILRILLAIALYLFLFFAIFTIWRDLRRQVKAASDQKIPLIVLKSESPEAKSYSAHDQTELMIGRQTDCEIVAPDDTVSSRHASLSFHHKQWWVKDLGSKNGTYLNSEKIAAPTVLMTGDQIRCGNHTWTVEIQSEQNIPEKKVGN